MHAIASHGQPIAGIAKPVLGVLAAITLGLLVLASCDGGSNSNDGSSVKPAQDAAGAEYDRRRRRDE